MSFNKQHVKHQNRAVQTTFKKQKQKLDDKILANHSYDARRELLTNEIRVKTF